MNVYLLVLYECLNINYSRFPHNCTAVLVVCPNDLGVNNGRVSYSTPGDTIVGTTATYTCDDGFNLNGKMDRVCQSNGLWSDSPPTCGK